jgi:hypothetical protein
MIKCGIYGSKPAANMWQAEANSSFQIKFEHALDTRKVSEPTKNKLIHNEFLTSGQEIENSEYKNYNIL